MTKPRTAKRSLSDKVAAVKRDNILDAAQEVFAKRGYSRTTIKDIAKQAGVADGTVYNYFDSKDELLSALFDKLHLDIRENDMAAGQPTLAHIQKSLAPQTLELVRVMLSELLIDESLRERYRDRMLAPLLQMSEPTEVDQKANPLSQRIGPATALGLTVLKLLGDEIVDKNWDDVPEFLLTLAPAAQTP